MTTYVSPHNCCRADSVIRGASSILRVSRQIRFEAIFLFYGANVFFFCSEWAMAPFLYNRTASARANVRRIALKLTLISDGHHRERQDRRIKDCEYIVWSLPRLESLQLEIWDWDGRLLGHAKEGWILSESKEKSKWILWLPALMEIDVQVISLW